MFRTAMVRLLEDFVSGLVAVFGLGGFARAWARGTAWRPVPRPRPVHARRPRCPRPRWRLLPRQRGLRFGGRCRCPGLPDRPAPRFEDFESSPEVLKGCPPWTMRQGSRAVLTVAHGLAGSDYTAIYYGTRLGCLSSTHRSERPVLSPIALCEKDGRAQAPLGQDSTRRSRG